MLHLCYCDKLFLTDNSPICSQVTLTTSFSVCSAFFLPFWNRFQNQLRNPLLESIPEGGKKIWLLSVDRIEHFWYRFQKSMSNY